MSRRGRTGEGIAQALAYAFLAAPAWDRASLAGAGRDTVGRPHRWLSPVVRTVLATYRRAPVDEPRALARVTALSIRAAMACCRARASLSLAWSRAMSAS